MCTSQTKSIPVASTRIVHILKQVIHKIKVLDSNSTNESTTERGKMSSGYTQEQYNHGFTKYRVPLSNLFNHYM